MSILGCGYGQLTSVLRVLLAVYMGLTSQQHQVESLNVRCSNKASETIYFLYQSRIQPPLPGVRCVQQYGNLSFIR